MLTTETITFGKYRKRLVSEVLRDRNYCNWLVDQYWFQNNYKHLYTKMKEYNPKTYFINTEEKENTNFLTDYEYFNLTPIEKMSIQLSEADKICYTFYIEMINKLKQSIYNRIENEEENTYDIKAPSGWLKYFEETYHMPREDFKDFLNAYELLNLPYIIERIKKEGGIEYKGAQSFKIAKARSESQEYYWERILSGKYKKQIGIQFKYENCIFDFINISTKTIFECKLGLKDFDKNQYKKYKVALDEFKIIYLIGQDCIIHLTTKHIYTTDLEKYQTYILNIPSLKLPSYLDIMILEFEISEVEDITNYISL